LRRADFRALAVTAGLRASEADTAIDETLQLMSDALGGIGLPKAIEPAADMRRVVEDMLDICRKRMAALS